MKKRTKNIISREGIEKKLCADNVASLKVSVLAFLATSLVGILWVAFFISFLLEAPNFGFGVLFFLFTIVGTVPAWVMLARLLKDLIECKHLKNGDIEIVTLPLLYETAETRYTRKTRVEYTQYKFHFEGFDALLASSEQSEQFTRGDKFYIVYYKGSKKIRLLYSCAFYEYTE